MVSSRSIITTSRRHSAKGRAGHPHCILLEKACFFAFDLHFIKRVTQNVGLRTLPICDLEFLVGKGNREQSPLLSEMKWYLIIIRHHTSLQSWVLISVTIPEFASPQFVGMVLQRTSIEPENTFKDWDRKFGHISPIKITVAFIQILYERKRIQETISH